ncbi:MAG: metal-dependent transcriptional regulator [Thermodesulfovibrionia bacterium]|nr:metal-dependent transcriptional regulator [Thermodesulfovibrionia bacterium]
MISKLADEILELMWALRERGIRSCSKVIEDIADNSAPDVIGKMENAGLVTISGDNIQFTEKGESRSRDLTRRHRLAERLFHDVLDVSMQETEDTACEIEHFLSPSVTESVCSFLGHPPTCPHGKPIPRGDCCSRYKTVRPLVMQLKELDVGTNARIVFIVPKEEARIDRLTSMGVVPGSIIKLKQKRPSFILKIDETSLAIDPVIAEEIYVKQV